jgi:phage FluMu gp28-like protein
MTGDVGTALNPIIRFHPYQRRWIGDDSRFKIGMFARQTGKTFTTCAEVVDDCVQAEIKGTKTRWVILSRGERQAAEAMDEAIKPFVRAFYLIYAAVLRGKKPPEFSEEEWRVEREDGSVAVYKALEVRFPGGSRITALPANPDTARGYSANVFLDEFAFHKNSRDIWKALFPIISKGNLKLRITSTPNGKDNKFYELWTAEDKTWSRHQVDIYQAVAEGLERDVELLRTALNDQEAWEQEFELKFLDASTAWLSYDVIMACEDPDAGKPELYAGGPCFIGNDIARRGDLWVAWVWEQVGDIFWTRELVELKNASFAAQDAEIARLMARYNVFRLVMDQTGMGEKPVEDAQRAYGYRVEGAILAGNVRLNIATISKQRFEDRKVRIPAGNAVLRADLHKLQRVQGDTGAPRLVADRDGDGHADRTWAAFLGLAGASPDPGILSYYERLAQAMKAAQEKAKEAQHGQA